MSNIYTLKIIKHLLVKSLTKMNIFDLRSSDAEGMFHQIKVSLSQCKLYAVWLNQCLLNQDIRK